MTHHMVVMFTRRRYYETVLDTLGDLFEGRCTDSDNIHIEESLCKFAADRGHAVIIEHVAAPERLHMMPAANA